MPIVPDIKPSAISSNTDPTQPDSKMMERWAQFQHEKANSWSMALFGKPIEECDSYDLAIIADEQRLHYT